MSASCDIDAWENLQLRLESAYSALQDSVHDPLTSETDLGGALSRTLSRMYCDCEEDEEAGREKVIQRVRDFPVFLHQFLAHHTRLATFLEAVDDASSTGARHRCLGAATKLAQVFSDHTQLIMVAREAGADFLSYPRCLPGHYHVGKVAMELSFNPHGTRQGMAEQSQDLMLAIKSCKGKPTFSRLLTPKNPAGAESKEAGIGTYRSKLELVTMNLREYGLRVLS